jgi:hypothetical protein
MSIPRAPAVALSFTVGVWTSDYKLILNKLSEKCKEVHKATLDYEEHHTSDSVYFKAVMPRQFLHALTDENKTNIGLGWKRDTDFPVFDTDLDEWEESRDASDHADFPTQSFDYKFDFFPPTSPEEAYLNAFRLRTSIRYSFPYFRILI